MLVRRKSSRYINECQQCQYFWYEKCSNKYITLLDTLCNTLHSPRLYVTFLKHIKFASLEPSSLKSWKSAPQEGSSRICPMKLWSISGLNLSNLSVSKTCAAPQVLPWSVKTIEKLLEAIRRLAYLWCRIEEEWSKHNEALTSWYVSIHKDGFSK